MTKQVTAGGVTIGGGADVTVQSMTNTDTADAEATLAQIVRLHQAGCQLVRVTVNTDKAAAALPKLVGLSPVPLVADIHFNHRLAIRAAEAGIAKLRINPGNIGGEAHVRELADCLRVHRIPVRIGVNAGSLEKELLRKHGAPTPAALVESALNHARLLEKYGFNDIVLSVKASSARATVDAYRLASKACDYPLHIGVTEAGTGELGIVKSAAALGALLLDGIGDTLRVSLTGDPVPEVQAGIAILRAVGLRRDFVEVISCPTCGRTEIDVEGIARRVQLSTSHIDKPLKVAVMGCVVNGPGEAREADCGIAGGSDGGVLFVKGQPPHKVEGDLYEALMEEVRRLTD
ncbi:MAG: flavodoxin-dependent (E)-4-hydroxy-3-methylbut-2-enyl-diphosphate synthase [Eubacteriales bacterium]|nr:flavodoxin-dependent (E)-4-hydroxy-3-methylbut-2-enyl-diphosphate synthase [Christensenellaceae bacterium]MEA5064585.1 flavodoxin-dependent (E)-4-hydroxy-3-methylbut-2-enyl-diphosphate synthase [Eubacteriales bacterium]